MTGIEDLPGRMSRKVTEVDGCWLWTGARNSKGYPCVTDGTGRSMLAHRRSYMALVGEIPDGLTIDHLCRNKTCVNPAHLEAVTSTENTRRAFAVQTHCKRGHELSGDNLHVRKKSDGYSYRECLICRRATNARARAKFAQSNRVQPPG